MRNPENIYPGDTITREQAVALFDSNWWEGLEARSIAMFQLWEDRLCMPFDVFHRAIEKAVGRPVYTHEFAVNRDGLKSELLGESDPPTLTDIINLIPEDKRIVVMLEDQS